MSYLKECLQCHATFDATNHHHVKFCSQSCANLWKTQQPKLKREFVCIRCGKQFIDWSYKQRQFCSKQCKCESQIFRSDKQCQHCLKSFEVINAEKDRKYCSKKCEAAARIKPEVHTVYVCNHCGKSFSGYTFLKKKYCCNKCMVAHQRGKTHPLWKGGTNRYRGSNWRVQRKAALERDNYTCQLCRKHHNQLPPRSLSVHHITSYREFNNDWATANHLTNLICLCRSCHRIAESGKISIQRKLI